MDSLQGSVNYQPIDPNHSELSPELHSPELGNLEGHPPALGPPLFLENLDKQGPAHQELPPPLHLPINLPPQSDSAEHIASRKAENAVLDQGEQLEAKLREMSKGVTQKRSLTQPLTAGVDLAKKGWDHKEAIAKEVPFGVGFAVEGYIENKHASDCRKEAKVIEKSIRNYDLSKKEIKGIKKELKEKRAEKKDLEKQILHLDKTMSGEHKELKKEGGFINVDRIGSQILDREELQHALQGANKEIQTIRYKLYRTDIPTSELDSKMDQLDQKVKEQKQHERKGFGAGTRGATLGAYNILTVGKIASGVVDIGVAASVLTPVTAGVGLAAGGIGVTLHTRNIVKAKKAMNRLKTINKEGEACESRGVYYQTIHFDPTKDVQTKKISEVKAKIELETASVIEDFTHNEIKKTHRKIVSNTIGLAENSALIASSTFSLLSAIPEPVTATTMYTSAMAVGLAKYGFMAGETVYTIGGEVLAEKYEKKLRTRRDFDVEGMPAERKIGISKSELGVDIRLAQMIKHGFAPPSVLKYHGIIDEKGFVEFVTEVARELGDRQEYKKGKAVISDYIEHVEKHFADLASQLAEYSEPPQENVA